MSSALQHLQWSRYLGEPFTVYYERGQGSPDAIRQLAKGMGDSVRVAIGLPKIVYIKVDKVAFPGETMYDTASTSSMTRSTPMKGLPSRGFSLAGASVSSCHLHPFNASYERLQDTRYLRYG